MPLLVSPADQYLVIESSKPVNAELADTLACEAAHLRIHYSNWQLFFGDDERVRIWMDGTCCPAQYMAWQFDRLDAASILSFPPILTLLLSFSYFCLI